MCDKVVCEEPFMLKCCPDRYKACEICDKAVDFCLITLQFVPDWFAANKIYEKLDNMYFLMMIYFFMM